MNKIRLSIVAAAVGLVLTACNDENPWATGDGEGRISPNVAADPTVKDVAPKVRAGEDGFPVPEVADMKLSLTKSDGTLSQTWESATLFPTDKNYKIGTYTLEAFYGDAASEGFECPYFYGKADFQVLEGEVSEPVVTATLANTMVSVEYTQDFINYFKAYKTQLHSAGGDFITLIPGESRPAFLRPGEVTVTLDITKQNGVGATLEPAKFEALARHHYHLTLDVNGGETGAAQLVVNFDESIVTEDVIIDLSDDLMLSPEPTVNPVGFIPDDRIELIEGTVPASPVQFVITAMGGLQSVTLTTESQQLIANGFPAEIDLMAATEAQKALLTRYGLEVKGLWHNPDKMASVDITNLLANLKGQGVHKFSVVAKDKLTKVNLPVTAVFTTEPVVLDITSAPSIFIGATEGSLVLDYNGDSPEKNIAVEAMDAYGAWKDCPVTSVAPSSTRSAASYVVRFTLQQASDDVKVRVKYKGEVKDSETLAVKGVSLSVNDADVWASHADLKVKKKTSVALSDIKFFVSDNGRTWTATSANIDASSSTVSLSGLEPGKTYYVKASDTGVCEESYPYVTFTTESAMQPQNAGFETWSQSQGWNKKVAGIGKETIYEYYPGSGPNDYWATSNSMTAGNWGFSSCFYNAYSGTYSGTGSSGKGAVIRSTGWANTSANTYTALGGNCNQVSPGILFMGEFSYDHATNTQTISLGRPFTSRPSSVTFDYTYAPVSGESWDVVVVVEHRSGSNVTELARGSYTSGQSVGSFTSMTVPLTYSNKSLKATHAYVYFRSSTASSPAKQNIKGSASAFQGYSDSRYAGSELTIDNIVFKY